jgi:hypothetical protein
MPARIGVVRRAMAACCLLLYASAAAIAQDRKLPQRNLLVEVRQGDEAALTVSGGGVGSGEVVIGSAGQVSGRAGVQVESNSRASTLGTTQQVRVLNGGRASVRLAQALPLQWWEVIVTPRGPQVVSQTTWAEAARGFVVLPRWPGGDAPVTVEIQAESGHVSPPGALQPLGQPPAAVDTARTLTTVQLPPHGWVTVASSGEADGERSRGVLSSRDAQRSRRWVVQLRVSPQ